MTCEFLAPSQVSIGLTNYPVSRDTVLTTVARRGMDNLAHYHYTPHRRHQVLTKCHDELDPAMSALGWQPSDVAVSDWSSAATSRAVIGPAGGTRTPDVRLALQIEGSTHYKRREVSSENATMFLPSSRAHNYAVVSSGAMLDTTHIRREHTMMSWRLHTVKCSVPTDNVLLTQPTICN